MNLFQHAGRNPKDVEGIVMSSVVPTINFTIEHMCQNYFGITPMVIGPGIKTGINIRYENPRELGSDRIANAANAYMARSPLPHDPQFDLIGISGIPEAHSIEHIPDAFIPPLKSY